MAVEARAVTFHVGTGMFRAKHGGPQEATVRVGGERLRDVEVEGVGHSSAGAGRADLSQAGCHESGFPLREVERKAGGDREAVARYGRRAVTVETMIWVCNFRVSAP